jgi:hypothetical protein
MNTSKSDRAVAGAAIGLLLLCGSVQAGDQPVQGKLDGTKQMRDGLALSYKHVLEGNQADIKKNLQYAARFEKQARQMKGEKARVYMAISQEFAAMAKVNERIIQGFEPGSTISIDAEMIVLAKHEDKVFELYGKSVKRSWLTFAEVRQHFEAGYYFETEHPEVLPHHRDHWKTDRLRPGFDKTEDGADKDERRRSSRRQQSDRRRPSSQNRSR